MAFEELSRRELIKIMGAGMASVYLGGCSSMCRSAPGGVSNTDSVVGTDLAAFGPFDRTLASVAPRAFSGDLNPERIHHVLWHKSRFEKNIGGAPAPSEFVDVIVIGGGMGGLLSTHFLKKYKPVVLEQAPRFGGNSRGESWNGIDYSIATAYFDIPEKGSAVSDFIHEIGVADKIRIHKDSDPIFIDGKRYNDIWAQGTNPESKKQFVRLNKHFEDMAANANGLIYPIVPTENPAERHYINKLDGISFRQYIDNFLGEPMHPHVEHVLEHYFWSADACSSKEISAAVGLNFFVGDFNEVAVLPGGNGAIAEATLKSILQEVPKENLRPSSLVFDVRVREDGVDVTYLDAHDKAITIRGKTVVMSCPKFVVAKITDGLEHERLEAIKKQKYRSYVVANLLINKKVPDFFYDLFVFSEYEMKIEDTKKEALKQKATDLVYGNFNNPDQPQCVLTLFRGYPYDGARKEIYDPKFYDSVRSEFETQIKESILPLLGLTPDNIVDLRLARWGHPLPVPQIGNISEGRTDIMREPFKDRVFFVEQDNWTVPSFESVFHEAKTWTPHVEKFLEKYSSRAKAQG